MIMQFLIAKQVPYWSSPSIKYILYYFNFGRDRRDRKKIDIANNKSMSRIFFHTCVLHALIELKLQFFFATISWLSN